VELIGPSALMLRVMLRPAHGVSRMFLLTLAFLPLPTSLAQEMATKENLSDIYMLHASGQLCRQDFRTFDQEHLDSLASAAKELENALELSAEEMQALRDRAHSAAAALYSLATPQYQWQQCEQLRGMVEVHLREKKGLDTF
jgi:hypothetical protein